MSSTKEISSGREILPDDYFRSSNGAKDFFKRKDRSKSYDMPNVSGVRTLSWNMSGTSLASGADNKVVSVGNLDPHSCRLGQYVPMAIEEQVSVIYAGVKGYLDKIDPSQITRFEKEFVAHIRAHAQELLKIIREKGQITTTTDDKHKNLVQTFIAAFKH